MGDLDLLYRVTDGGDRLVIPASGGLRQVLLGELHDSLLAGHLGARKTLQALQARVWWPHMERLTREYVASCPVCQRVKDSTQAKPGEMQPL